jgi:chemotaxis protein methyltransferase CheR
MPLAPVEIAFLKQIIAERSGNVISANQDYLLESRLAPVAKSVGLPNVNALVAELKKQPGGYLPERIAEAMTINETSFFRDGAPFEALRTDILPTLIQKRSATKTINVWCGASSSGQEPYSIAMTIREFFNELNAWNVRILATDLSEEMVKRTAEGSYSQFEMNRGLPTALLVKHFDRNGANWRAKPELRKIIDARRMNLTGAWPTTTFYDVVFLRNVLIYFDQPSKERILTRIAKVMRPDGYLFLGGGETLINLNVPFLREPIGKTVCFRPVTT